MYPLKEASIIANKHLNSANPIRLAVAVSKSLLYRHLLGSDDKALVIAKDAYEKALLCLAKLANELKPHANEKIKLLNVFIYE